VVTAAGDRRMRRRGRRRHGTGSTPAAISTPLREAREASNVTLAEVHDRTGVPWPQLEALEAGELSRFPDLRSALTAVRRYADLMHLDGEPLAKLTEEHWGTVPAGFAGGTDAPGASDGRHTQSVYTGHTTSGGHLSRYPGDGTHLRAFTQTDEVPGVRRAALARPNGHDGSGQFSVTGSFPATPVGLAYVKPAPLVLRGAVWVAASLLVVALGGLAVQHYQPKWLKDIHLVRNGHTGTRPPSAGATTPSHHNAPAHPGLVTETDTGTGSATVSVHAASYTVLVAAWGRCWTVVHTPQSFSPVFAETLPAGQSKEFDSFDGKLTVSVSAALVTMEVKVGGKPVPGWIFKPPSVPFVLNFNSTVGP
jgi:hypothetical protein